MQPLEASLLAGSVASKPKASSSCIVLETLGRNLLMGAGQLAKSDWWGRQGSVFPSVPSELALQDVLRDLFGALSLPAAFAGASPHTAAPELGTTSDAAGFSQGLPNAAPAASLAAR